MPAARTAPPPSASPDSLAVAMVAGEASGDLLAALLLGGLRQRWSNLRTAGIGGPLMARQGFQAWWPHDKLSVHGFGLDVLLRYPGIVQIRRQLRARLLREPPDLFIGVDAPDFNLDLEADLKSAGIRTVHFVSPSVWAWRAHRLQKIRRSADHVLCLFPFEPALLAQHGISASYVGHPLASLIPMAADQATARSELGLAADDLVLAVLPGSRESEIAHLAQRFFEAAAIVCRERPGIKVIVPAVPALQARIAQAAQRAGMSAHVRIVTGQSHRVLAACDLTLIASGTATLEAALFKKPMVIAYNMSWLSWKKVQNQRLQPWVGLPNVLCQDFVVPELLQDAATPAALAHAVLSWVDALACSSERMATLKHRFTLLHAELLRDTSRLAADAIEQVLNR